ncbi:MAG: APC family permease [Kutzneria sp.]|nr:APC family permease [Kutzneria sp.]
MSPARGPAKAKTAATALAANRLGIPSVTYFVISMGAPMTIVVGAVTTGYSVTGLIGIPLGFVVMGIVLALFCVGYVKMAPHVPNAGAFNAYVSKGMNRPLGVAAGWGALLAYNGMQIGFYGALADASGPLFRDWFGINLPWWVLALAGWAVVAVIGLQHIDLSGRVLSVLMITECAVIVLFSVACLVHPANNTVTFDTLSPDNLFKPGAGVLLAIAVLGFVGFETAVVFSEEAKQPRRTVPVTTFLSLGAMIVLYTLGSWAMSVATGPDNVVQQSREHGTDLIFFIARQHLGGALADIGRVMYITSVLAGLIAFHNAAARYKFSLGRERVLPAFLGKTSQRTSSPKTGSITQSVLALIVLLVYAFAGWDPVVQLFFWWTAGGSFGILLLVALTSIAVVGFFLRHPSPDSTWQSLVVPIIAAIGCVVSVALVLANFAALVGVDEDSPLRWGIPAVYLVVGALAVVWALTLRTIRPHVYATIGLGAKSVTGTGLGLGNPDQFLDQPTDSWQLARR